MSPEEHDFIVPEVLESCEQFDGKKNDSPGLRRRWQWIVISFGLAITMALPVFPGIIHCIGNLNSEEIVYVALPSPGYMEEYFVNEGQEVSKGDVLAKCYMPAFENSRVQALVNLGSSRETKGILTRVIKPFTEVLEGMRCSMTSGGISQVKYYEYRQLVERLNLEMSLAEVREAGARKILKFMDDITYLRAPCTGTIMLFNNRNIPDLGWSIPGQQVCAVASGARVVDATVSERYALRISTGQSAVIICRLADGRIKFKGRVVAVAQHIDRRPKDLQEVLMGGKRRSKRGLAITILPKANNQLMRIPLGLKLNVSIKYGRASLWTIIVDHLSDFFT
jgi:hypothetical protein